MAGHFIFLIRVIFFCDYQCENNFVIVEKESDPSYLSVCQLFEDYFDRMKDLYDYVNSFLLRFG